MTATLMGGLGSASIVTGSGATVGALVAVNAFGSVCAPGSREFWAGAFEIGDEFGGLGPSRARGAALHPAADEARAGGAAANTTIAIVATDVALDKAGARRLAEVAHGGLARAIHPAHTAFDGDLVFAVSTGRREPAARAGARGDGARAMRRRTAWRGPSRAAVWAARPAPGNPLPCWSEGASLFGGARCDSASCRRSERMWSVGREPAAARKMAGITTPK